jgi:hypothetical protein
MPGLRHRLAVPLLLALFATPSLAASIDAAAPARQAVQPLEQTLADTIELAESGDSVGALLGFERVFADPGFAQLPEPSRLDGWIIAGRVAFNARQPRDARRYLDAALKQAPDDPRALYVLGRLLLWQEQPVQGATLITRSLRASDQFLGDVDASMAHALDAQLQDQPETRRALLQVLFDRQWTDDGMQPTSLWLALATLQADAGQQAALAATVARIDTPMEVVALRSDKRFDAVVDRRDPRFDPLQSARRHVDALRVEGLLRPERGDRITELTDTLLLMGEHEQVLSTTEALYTRLAAADAPPSFRGADYAAWMLMHRATAEHRLGRDVQAEATLVLASTLHEQEPAFNPLMRLYLASWYVGKQQPERALQTMDGLDEGAMYGEYVRQWIRFNAYRSLGDATRSAQARQWLQSNQGEGRSVYLDVLIAEDRLDDAAAWLITALQDPRQRQELLQLLQDFRMLPPMPADVDNDKRWAQLLKRRDVRAAVAAVGRIETLPIHGRSVWR